MTVNAKDLPTNNLNINEIEQNTSPNSLELGSGKEGEYTYSKTLAKLLDVVAGTEASGYTQAPVPATTASYSLDELAGPVLCEFTETSI